MRLLECLHNFTLPVILLLFFRSESSDLTIQLALWEYLATGGDFLFLQVPLSLRYKCLVRPFITFKFLPGFSFHFFANLFEYLLFELQDIHRLLFLSHWRCFLFWNHRLGRYWLLISGNLLLLWYLQVRWHSTVSTLRIRRRPIRNHAVKILAYHELWLISAHRLHIVGLLIRYNSHIA